MRQPDPNDEATRKCPPPAGRDYTAFLNPDGLRGARIGIPARVLLRPGHSRQRAASRRIERHPARDHGLGDHRAQAKGAVIVDPANIPSVVDTSAANNFLNWNVCSGLDQAKGRDADCSIAFKYGMKRDFDAWLKTLGDMAPVKTLTELRQWNIAHQRAGAIKYGQANLDVSDEMNLAGRSRAATRRIGGRTSCCRRRTGSTRR